MKTAGRFLSLGLVVNLLLSASVYATGSPHVIDRFDHLDIRTAPPGAAVASFDGPRLVLSIDCSEPRQASVTVPFGHTVKDSKVLVSVGGSRNVSYIGKLERLDDGTPIPRTFEHAYIEYQKGPMSFSLDNKHHEDLTFYFYCIASEPGRTAALEFEKVEVAPLAFSDDRDFVYLLAIGLLAAFLIPGLLTFTALFGGGDRIGLLALLTPVSIVFFIALYAVLLAHQAVSEREAGAVLLSAYVAFNLGLVAWLHRSGRLREIYRNLVSIRYELLAVAIVVLCAAALLSEDLELPLYTFNHLHLRNLTYGIFYAHDSIFQYVNGIAIYHDEPFSRYYADEKLVYDVQDRGIVAGVVYAVLRGIASPLSSSIAYGSGYYTLYGALLNALVLLPLLAVHAWFVTGRSRPLLVLLLVAASGFFVTNILITWYKLAGAGIAISGIVVLLTGGDRLRPWLVAGLLWGLATNFHPGLALTYPIVSIWLLWRYFMASGRKWLAVPAAFACLFGAFVLMNVPWSAVKATHYEDTNELFRQHFLDFQKYDPERGITGSIENFMDRHPVEKQIRKRTDRLANSLRSDEWSALTDPEKYEDWDDLMYRWNALETSYLVFILLPLLVLLTVSALATRLLPATGWKTPVTAHRTDFLWLLITQALTIVLVILASFGPFEPDINWHIPMSCTVLVIYLLVHATAATGRIGAFLAVSYAVFSSYRLFFQYF